MNVEALALDSLRCALTAVSALGSDRATEVRAELVAASFDSVTDLRVSGRKTVPVRGDVGLLPLRRRLAAHARELPPSRGGAQPGARRHGPRALADALDELPVIEAETAALALLERGGIAHLSLARTADELLALPARTVPCSSSICR